LQVYNKTIIRQIKDVIILLRNAYSVVHETIGTLKSYKNTVSAVRFMVSDVEEFVKEVNEFHLDCQRLIKLLEVLNDAQVEIGDDELLKIATTNCSSFVYRTIEYSNFPEGTANVLGSKRITEHTFILHGGI
jgi:hypothetical protein